MARGRPGKSGRSRGEINEIVAQMEQLSALDGRRPDVIQLKRDCFQKLIRYMTAGIDMSAAFIPATKCVALSKSDLPLKKMLYLYLRSAARQNEAVALLVVQTLLTDSKDADPTIRGLAVRSMCSLRVPELMENVFSAVDGALRDAHPYVREVAVIGVLKCFHQDAAGTRLRGFPETVRSLLTSDPDPQVIANCLYVLQQLGGLDTAVTRPFVVSLLNHIRAFSDWAQCLVLDVLLAHYRPETEAERFDMLEVLDFGLNHTNSAVVMATAKLFLHYTASYPEQYNQVLASIRGPLQTLLLGRETEVVFSALSNLIVLAQRHPAALSGIASDLFCRPEDPSYLKLLKIEALVAVADASNAYDAAEEASQYSRDYADGEVTRAAVRAVARIALKVPEVDGILDRLLLFLGHQRGEVAGEAVAAMADVLRRFPDAAEACVPAVAEVGDVALERPPARAAYCWVLGEFGERLQDAPYILEALVDKFSEQAAEVKLALLTAVAKLFFKRAPECRLVLGAVLAAGIADSDPAVSERAALYHRLLKDAGAEAARQVIAAPRPAIARFEEGQSAEVSDKIFDEWNTLSAVYRAPAATFIDLGDIGSARHEVDSIGGDGVEIDGGVGGGVDDGTALLLDLDSEGGGSEGGLTGASPSPSPSPSGGDLLASAMAELSSVSSQGQPAAMPAMHASTLAPKTSATAFDMLGGDLLGGGGGGPAGDSYGGGNTSAAAPSLEGLGGFDFSSLEPSPAAPVSAAPISDLDMDFLGGLGTGGGNNGGASAPHPAPTAAPQNSNSASISQDISLVQNPSISPEDFRRGWAEWNIGALSFSESLAGQSAVAAVESRGFRNFSEHVAQANISTFATPQEGSSAPYRFLLFAQRQGPGAHVLVELSVSKVPPTAVVTVKSKDGAAATFVKELLQTLLLTL